VVLAGSAGGVRAVRDVLQALPPQFPAPIVVALHRPARPSHDGLPDVLRRRTSLRVQNLGPSATLDPGCVHLLPPRTVLASGGDGSLRLEAVDHWRTADPTMCTLARHYGPDCLAVVLSGRLDDGAAGARAVKRARGRVVVQDPADAEAPGMPAAALATGCVDLVVPLRRVAQTIVALTMAPGGADLLRVPRAPWAS
jgi:two-component system, chemotaxis family, protein-glutamate methylesterase/glutaminase